MIRMLSVSLFAVASLVAASGAGAATKVTTKQTTTTTHRAAPRMVTAKTSTGKSITYDCSKAGNATKAACKK